MFAEFNFKYLPNQFVSIIIITMGTEVIEKEFSGKITLLDKYILRQIIEMFIMGVCVFTSIIFASDTFITLIKQISLFGIPFKVALMMIILNFLPLSVFIQLIMI